MVLLQLSSPKGNQGLRYFPHTGYLGLTPVRVEGIVRTKPDPDTRSCHARSISISVRCYEARVGRVSILHSRLLVDYTQILWSKPDDVEYEQISALEFPFRITVPARVAGFSTASYVDYRCTWRVEAVLNHAPTNGIGSRQIRYFDLPLVRYDLPPPVPRPFSTWAFLDSHKPRAPRIRYALHSPISPIGPLDLVPVTIHVQPVDPAVSVRSASVTVERRIHLLDCPPSSSTSTSSLQAPLSPVQPLNSSSSELPSDHPVSYSDPHSSSSFDLDSVDSFATITPSVYSSTAALLPHDHISSSPSSPSHPPSKTVVNSIADVESSGYFTKDDKGVWSKTLTLQWPASRSHSRWTIGETTASDLVSVKYFVRTKIVVSSSLGTETLELPEQEVTIVSTNETERQLAMAKYQEMEAAMLENRPSSSHGRSKSKSPRRSKPDAQPVPPTPLLDLGRPSSSNINSNSAGGSHKPSSSGSRSGKPSTRRPHTSAGPRDKPINFAGGAYSRPGTSGGSGHSRGQENEPLLIPVSASSSSTSSTSGTAAAAVSSTALATSTNGGSGHITKRRSDVLGFRSFQRSPSDLESKQQQHSGVGGWTPPPSSAGGKLSRITSATAGFWGSSSTSTSSPQHHQQHRQQPVPVPKPIPIPPPRIKDSTSTSTTASSSSMSSSSGYTTGTSGRSSTRGGLSHRNGGGDTSTSASDLSDTSDSVMKEWEEELVRIEVKSRRSSDLLGFFGRNVKGRGGAGVKKVKE